MKKIINFFNLLGEKTLNFFTGIKKIIFRKSEAEQRKLSFKKGIGLGIVAAIVLVGAVGLVWLGWNKLVGKNQTDQTATAEAKVYIVTASDCGKQCWDTQLFLDALTQKGVKIAKKQKAYVSWFPFSSGNAIVKKYGITKIPTVIVEFTGKNQPDINQFFNSDLGRVVDGRFVLDKILAPYYDLSGKKIKGLVNITYLTDKDCKECYDISRHEVALKNLGVNTQGKNIDINSKEGQDLIAKYKITKIPTVLISGEVSEYQVLAQAWADVGIVADDGTYIFTNVDLMGDSYKDLSTGKIIEANPEQAAPATAQ